MFIQGGTADLDRRDTNQTPPRDQEINDRRDRRRNDRAQIHHVRRMLNHRPASMQPVTRRSKIGKPASMGAKGDRLMAQGQS